MRSFINASRQSWSWGKLSTLTSTSWPSFSDASCILSPMYAISLTNPIDLAVMASSSLHATACIGCRRRGRKCDRTLPTCLACEKRGVSCDGYVTKWPGVAARGKLAGKSIPVVNSSVGIAQSDAQLTRAQQKRTRTNASSSFTDEEIDNFVQHCKLAIYIQSQSTH